MDVRTLCLGVLTMGDASGYEIKKRLENEFSHFYDASFGSIYPALSKLQTEGLVNCTYEAQSKRPDKKVYSLTPGGRLTLVQELSEEPAPDRIRSEFLVSMLFARLLPAGHVADIIDNRIDEFQLKEGEMVKAHINISSKEANNGRWFTNVRAWKIEREGNDQTPPPSESDYIDVDPKSDQDDLPF